MDILAQEIGELLKKYKLTLGTVESATGGLISHRITDIPGSSDYYQGSIVSYSNALKMKLVGVKPETLEKYGAVSAQTALEMAEGGRKALGVDICLADTGIAGPTGATLGKPLGLFYLAISHAEGTFNRKYIFKGNRDQNKDQAAAASLDWLKEYLTGLSQSKDGKSAARTNSVVTAFLESSHKYLLLRRSDRVGTYRGQWGGVSGYIETTPEEQALKEIKEETGLDTNDVVMVRRGPPLEVPDAKLKTKWIVHPFLFQVKNTDKIKLDWEHRESKWIALGELEYYDTVPMLKEALISVLGKDE